MSVKQTGRMGEALAAEALEKSGYRIVKRNVYSRYGEVDLIAEGDGCICFVEVRARQKGSMVCPLESITPAKIRRIVATALTYLCDHPSGLQPRFDLFAITVERGKAVACEHIKGVFDADGY